MDFFSGANAAYAEDIDGDGDVDVLGAARTDDEIVWWENTDGTGNTWTEHPVDSEFDGAISVYATDMDGDGDVDILGAAHIGDEVSWWENLDGTGTSWTEHSIKDGSIVNGVRSIYATDIDGDGDVDVLGSISLTGRIMWWDITGFAHNGTLESSILFVDSVVCWDYFDFNGDVPIYTQLAFQFRSSQDSTNMGNWSSWVYSSTNLSGILADSTNF